MGFTKFCAALLNHPDPELQAIPRAVLEQVQYSSCVPGSTRVVSQCPPSLWQALSWQLRCWCKLMPPWQGSCRFQVTGFQAHLRWILFLCQGLEALSGPRSSSITRRAAGFPMLFLCIVSGEPPAQARPLLTHCIQTLLALAATALPQDWDQTLDLPQVSVALLAAGAP